MYVFIFLFKFELRHRVVSDDSTLQVLDEIF